MRCGFVEGLEKTLASLEPCGARFLRESPIQDSSIKRSIDEYRHCVKPVNDENDLVSLIVAAQHSRHICGPVSATAKRLSSTRLQGFE